MRIHRRRENLMQFAWKFRSGILANGKFTQGKVGVVAIGMIDATRWSSIWWCQRALRRWLDLWVWWHTWPSPQSLIRRSPSMNLGDGAGKNNFHWHELFWLWLLVAFLLFVQKKYDGQISDWGKPLIRIPADRSSDREAWHGPGKMTSRVRYLVFHTTSPSEVDYFSLKLIFSLCRHGLKLIFSLRSWFFPSVVDFFPPKLIVSLRSWLFPSHRISKTSIQTKITANFPGDKVRGTSRGT